MNESPHAGDRGVSILGALVVALMLGAGAVATFEFATPSLSQVSSESQTALIEGITKQQAAAEKAAKEKATREKEQREKAIQKKCEDVQKSLSGKPNGTKTSDSRTIIPRGKDDIEKNVCVGGIVEAGVVRCVGMATEVDLQSNGSVVAVSKADPTIGDAGTCRTKYCSIEKRDDTNKRVCQTPADISGFKPIRKQAREANAHKNPDFSNAQKNLVFDSGNLGAEGKILANELGLYEKRDEARRNLDEKQVNYQEAIADFAKDKSEENKVLLDAAKKERDEALKNYSKLATDIKRLEGSGGPPSTEVIEGPCPGGGSDCSETVKKVEAERRKLEKDLADSRSRQEQTGFNDPKDKGPGISAGQGPWGQQSLPNRPPAAGNGQPQPAGTCSPSVICGNNTLYARNNQCVDQVMQQCQYGCNGNQCATAPQQGQGCQQAPAQPDPSGCQNGSWRPTYTGACVSSWQCLPTGSAGGSITAQLSCQPQVADVGMTIAITYSCSSGMSEGSGFQTGGALTGSTTVTVANPPANTNVATYGLKCTEGSASATKQCNAQIAKPAIVLVANPKTVKKGKTSTIGWVTSGMQSCVISSPDLPDFTDEHKNTTNVNGTVTTPPLKKSADFLLKCVTLGGGTKEATTRVKIQ